MVMRPPTEPSAFMITSWTTPVAANSPSTWPTGASVEAPWTEPLSLEDELLSDG